MESILTHFTMDLSFILRFLYESLSIRKLPPLSEIKSKDRYAMTVTIHLLVILSNNFKISDETIFS